MKRFNLTPLSTVIGKPMQYREDDKGELKQATLADMLRILVLNIPGQRLTMKDCIEATRVLKQLDGCKDGLLEIEEAEHDWLKTIVEATAPGIFNINAIVIKEALDDFER